LSIGYYLKYLAGKTDGFADNTFLMLLRCDQRGPNVGFLNVALQQPA
jgi:hypothetical protein